MSLPSYRVLFETSPRDEQLRWAILITQARPRAGSLPQRYWWQGPAYRGDHLMERVIAELVALGLRTLEPSWSYEVRDYFDGQPVPAGI